MRRQKKTQELFQETTRQIEGLFDAITSGHIGQYFLKQFEHLVAQMVASWLTGVSVMQRGASGSIFGGSLGGLLGLGGLGGGIATPPFIQPGITDTRGNLPLPIDQLAGIPNLNSQVPLSGGEGVSTASGLPAGGSISTMGSAASLPGIAGALGKIFPHGVSIGGVTIGGAALGMLGATLGVSGFMSLVNANSTGGRVLGAAETIGGAALTGFAIGGPIGAVVGGIIGAIGSFFGWLFGSGKKKRQQQALNSQLQQQLQMVEDNYKFFKVDYSTARDEFEQLRQQFSDAEQKVGGKESQWVDPWVDRAIQDINTTEAERQRRAAISFGPAQFRTGGFVSPSLAMSGTLPNVPSGLHFGGGGAVPAILHAGEYVLRPEAVNNIGTDRLNRMNSGLGGGDTHLHFGPGSINTLEPRTFLEYLRRMKAEGWRLIN